NVQDLAVSDREIFFTTQVQLSPPTGTVSRLALDGGCATSLTTIQTPNGIAFAAGALVFGDGARSILRASIDDGTVVQLATTTGRASRPVTDGASVYFCDSDGVKAVPLSGGPPTLLASATCFSLTVGNSSLVLADFGGNRLLRVDHRSVPA